MALAGLLVVGTSGQLVGQGFTAHAYLEGRNFMRDGVPFYPVVMNYSIEFITEVVEPADTGAVRLSPSGNYDMNYVDVECDDQPECDAQLLAHFAKLRAMGFNTLRLTGQRLQLVKDAMGDPMLRFGIRKDGWYTGPYLRTLYGPGFIDPWSLKFFRSFRHFLDLAAEGEMNVIFLVSPSSAPMTDSNYYGIEQPAALSLMDAFLTRLTEELHNSPALMAIDLLNEPIWMHEEDNHLGLLTKQEVCWITTRWYDAIHAAGPPHPLVTLGGYGVHEAGSWDPAVMKLDFYSAHIYPEPTAVTDHDPQGMRDRVLAELHWVGSTCPMPWIIGETAFSADDDTVDPMDIEYSWGAKHLDSDPMHHQWPYMHGSELEQADYASTSIVATRNALGSGYSWWGFQNDRFGGEGTLDSAVQIPDKRTYLANFWGVLKYGNEAGGPPPWDTARPWRDKLVVDAFVNADVSPVSGSLGAAPSNYLNWHNLTGPVINSGTVYDQNSDPVSNGIVEVVWPGYVPSEPDYLPEGFFDRIPLDAYGHYEIHQAQSPLNTPLGIQYTQASGPRFTKLHVSGGGSIAVPHISSAVLNVDVARMPFERLEQVVAYGLADEVDLTAWSSVALHDVVAQGNGTTGAELNAWTRDAITVSGETHFQEGSEVHLWTAPTFPECGTTAYHMMLQSPLGGTSAEAPTARRLEKVEQIVLGFQLPEIEVLQDVEGAYAVFTSNGGPGMWHVFDAVGKLVWHSSAPVERVQCGTTAFARGEYTVLWQSGTLRRSKQFIRP